MSVERRLYKSGPNKGKPFYVVRIYQGKDKPYYEKVFDKKIDAETHENQIKNFRKSNPDRTVSKKTIFSVVLDRYLEKVGQVKKDQTATNYKSRINKWIRPKLGNHAVGDIDLDTLNDFSEELENDGASESMKNYCMIVLNQALKFACSGVNKYITYNPMDDWEWAEFETGVKKLKYWNKEEARKLLNEASGDHFYLMFVIMINTGIRIAEALALTREDFDFDTNQLIINKQISVYFPKKGEPKLDPSGYVVTTLKNQLNRAIPLNKAALTAAKLYIGKNKENYFLATSPTNQKTLVITKRGAKPTIVETSLPSKKTINDHLKVITAKADIKYIGAHGLRHTFGANFMMNGGDIYDLSTLLGHKSINSTQIYAHLSKKHLLKAVSIVNFEG